MIRRLVATLLLIVAVPAASKTPLLDEVRKRKELRIGLESIFTGPNPLYYRDQKTGEYFGYEIDLARFVAARLGATLSISPVKWDRIPEAVRRGTVDMGLNGLFIPPAAEIAATDAWSDPYLAAGIAVMRRAGTPEVSPAALPSARVAVLNDPPVIKLTKERGYKDVRTFDIEKDMFDALLRKERDVVLFDRPLLLAFQQQHTKDVVVAPGIVAGTAMSYGILVRREEPELLAAINAAIRAWKGSPEERASRARYGLDE